MMTTMFARGRAGTSGRSPVSVSVPDPQEATSVVAAIATPTESRRAPAAAATMARVRKSARLLIETAILLPVRFRPRAACSPVVRLFFAHPPRRVQIRSPARLAQANESTGAASRPSRRTPAGRNRCYATV